MGRTCSPITSRTFLIFNRYAVGKIQIGSFKVRSVTGVLITGVIIGQLNITIDDTVKSVFFLLFLFALGYNAGPQFFKGLKRRNPSSYFFCYRLCYWFNLYDYSGKNPWIQRWSGLWFNCRCFNSISSYWCRTRCYIKLKYGCR